MSIDLFPEEAEEGWTIERLRRLPQVEMPVTHRFQDGIYIREIFMPAGTLVAGHVHRHRHWNIIVTGRATVEMEGRRIEVNAGDVIESGPGVQKLLYILDDCRWITLHQNLDNCREISILEEDIVLLSPEEMTAKGSMTLDEFRMSLGALPCPNP